MKSQENIKNKFERNESVLLSRPSFGFGVGYSTVKIVNGLTCEISEGDWKLKTDMSEQVGGNSNAPSPGVLGRAAFGSCLATVYMMWASKLDIEIESLEINIEADYDDAGLFGTIDNFPGYSEVRYEVKIKSPHSKKEIEAFLDKADMHSPYLDVFSRKQKCIRELVLVNN